LFSVIRNNNPQVHGVRFPRKAKTSIVKGVEEDREVAVPGAPKVQAVTWILSLVIFTGGIPV
jgi:hypothetical protein